MKLKNTLTSIAVAATTLTSCSVADPFDFSEIYIREAGNIKKKCIKEKSEYLLKCLQGNDDKDYKGLIEKADSNLKEAEFDYGVVKGSKYRQEVMPWLLRDKKQDIISAEKNLHDLRSELIFNKTQINVDTLRSNIENCEGIHKLINHYGKDEIYNRISKFFNCVINLPWNYGYGYELNERGEYVLINKEQFKKKLSECFPEYKENNRNRTLYEIGDILIGFLTCYFIKLFKKEENQKNK